MVWRQDMPGLSPGAGGQGFSAESVRAQLDRVLLSQSFANAPFLSRLLRHLVEHTLRGEADRLKEYSLGVEVFDRGESFDPRTDTIVRVQARRLRSKLGEYYRAEGRADPIVIEVPKGHYAANFRPGTPPASPRRIDEALGRVLNPRPPALPAPRTRLIGRETELAAVRRLLLGEHARLVTLTGAGGSGKTRLALQAAAAVADDFPGGVYFVGLAAVTDPGTVAATIAQVLGVRHTGEKPLDEALPEHLRLSMPAPTLLFLDNFEQVLAAAELLVRLLEACPALKIFVTSRATLRVYGEHEYEVPPLAVPDLGRLPPLAQLSQIPAVLLFVERATAVKSAFMLTADNARAVVEICSRLDGLPLAIELAAARIKVCPPAAMLTRLEGRLDFLASGARDAPARQQTLRKTLAWSHDLLGAAEQKFFRRLSVFAGGCTLESAEAVCDTRRDLEVDVLGAMSSLVDQSLLQQIGQDGGEARFVMLETIREYGAERLAASGEEEATRRAHTAYCLVLPRKAIRRSPPPSGRTG